MESLGSEGIAVSDLWLWGNLAQRQLRLSPDSGKSGTGRHPNGLPEVSERSGEDMAEVFKTVTTTTVTERHEQIYVFWFKICILLSKVSHI